MEWLKAILEKAEIKDGKLDMEALMASITTEAPKNVIPKSEYNNVNKQLKTANETIKGLKKNNSDNETLQKTIKDHEETIKNLEETHKKEIADMKKDAVINQALVKAKAKYPEVVVKLLDKDKVVINEDGTIIGLDEQLKTTQENYKDMFEGSEDKPVYQYNPQSGSSGVSTGATSFVDIINENQAKR
ncbi:phage scaffolding protein [Clostridium cadaveris]|uniref:phage scaffolding protein n=1 Tax=Clostridium cadaveris TaxID=1529 RepID=UPI0015D4C5E5|nr:phage scaffolding protein [Clostridium cadaveris]